MPRKQKIRLATSETHVALSLEFMALANHRKVVRTEAVKFGEELRQIQHKALQRYLRAHGIKAPIPSRPIITLLAGVGLLRVFEPEAGMSFGHTATDAVVKSTLRGLARSAKK